MRCERGSLPLAGILYRAGNRVPHTGGHEGQKDAQAARVLDRARGAPAIGDYLQPGPGERVGGNLGVSSLIDDGRRHALDVEDSALSRSRRSGRGDEAYPVAT